MANTSVTLNAVAPEKTVEFSPLPLVAPTLTTVPGGAPLFSFANPKALTPEKINNSILALEEKRWEKAQRAAKDAEKEFTAAKPTLGDVQKYTANLNAQQALFSYATVTKDASALTDMPGTDADKRKLTTDAAKTIGALLIGVEKASANEHDGRPDVVIKGNDGKDYRFEPKEMSAYLQYVAANAAGKHVSPVDQWVIGTSIGLTGHASEVKNGADETLVIETREGRRRAVGNGVLTKPLAGYYGGIKGVTVGDGDDLDVYITPAIYKEIAAGNAYRGSVVVMQQMDKGKNDELKIGYAPSREEFTKMMESTWDKPADFHTRNEGKYAVLDAAQYTALKAAIKAKPDVTLDEFVAQQKAAGVTIALTQSPEALQLQAQPAAAKAAAAAPANAAPAPVHHIVKAGDSLTKIALAHEDLMAAAKAAIGGNVDNKTVMLAVAAVTARVNEVKSPKSIAVGQDFVLPTAAQIAAGVKDMKANILKDGRIDYASEIAGLKGDELAQMLPHVQPVAKAPAR